VENLSGRGEKACKKNTREDKQEKTHGTGEDAPKKQDMSFIFVGVVANKLLDFSSLLDLLVQMLDL
jgi:hypothetical protein